MAIPSGGGTEVLKRTTIHAQSNTATAFRWDGTMATTGTSTYTVPAHHIITVLTVIMVEQAGVSEAISLYMHDGTNNITILQAQTLPPYGTFVFNDRFILTGGDKLTFNCSDSANVDAMLNYIDQDWS